IRLALITLKGEMGYPSVLTAKTWGFYDVSFKGKPFELERAFKSYVMENVLFKISFPAEFHAQTAVECAVKLHPFVATRLDEVKEIVIHTHESAIRIIDKKGPLHNPADRDHCLQYMAAIGLIFGNLQAHHYEDNVARDSRIDTLREKMRVIEEPHYSIDYLDPNKRSISNAVQVFFSDGSKTDKIEIEYPIGHRLRRAEGIPKLIEKFTNALGTVYSPHKTQEILKLCLDKERFEKTAVHDFMKLLAK
ncbi:MAG: 2-methylcitrate dehydratase, partial [Pseudomonadota bacterium]